MTSKKLRWRIWTNCTDLLSMDFGHGDIVILRDTSCSTNGIARAACLRRGATLIDASDESASLLTGSLIYSLQGTPTKHWIAALSAFLDEGFAPQDALWLAWQWQKDRVAADDWPLTLDALPCVAALSTPHVPFARCQAPLGLYPLVPDVDWLIRLLDLGIKTAQLRCKSTDPEYLEQQVHQAVQAGKAYGAQVFINDHWQLALHAGAYGVHLGQEDLQNLDSEELEGLACAKIRLGISTHGVYEMRLASQYRPSYIAMGPIFATATKQIVTAPQGLCRLRQYVQLLAGQIPGVAIGGIGLAELPDVLATGVDGVALAGAVINATDVAKAVTVLQQVFGTSTAPPFPNPQRQR